MKALCTCAALAVATAIAHTSVADAAAQQKNTLQPFRGNASELTKIDDNLHCTVEINALRTEVDPEADAYTANTSGQPTTDLQNFLTTNDCDALKAGTFTHIHDVGGNKAFVFSATRPESFRREKMTCTEAVAQWKKGFETFEGKYPAKFQQNTGPYTDPNAVGLVSLLSNAAQPIFCGTPTGCPDGTLICYIKPAAIQDQQYPVTAEMWHKAEEHFKLKPKVVAHEDDNHDYMNAINEIRGADRLNLPLFTAVSAKKKLRLTKSVSTSYKDAMYNLTCDAINNSKIDPKVESDYTLIYAVKEGNDPPTPEEAVEFWKSGYAELGPDVPPAFKVKADMRAETVDGEIYYKSEVAGFVSMMVDTAREMRCYNATGCTKAAVVCFLSAPTLVENTPPISDQTWQKILTLESEENHDKSMTFTKLEENANCLTEINEFRTQDSLGLKAFVAKASTSSDVETASRVARDTEDLEVFTCASLKSGTAPILFPSTKRSVMYYYGSSTCSDAVTEWKKGYEKFKDVTVPPEYTSSEAMYSTGAATNFISLVSEGAETVVRCYSVSGCSEAGLVCVMEPPVFEDGKSPITEATWQKVTSTFSNGVSGTSVYGALLSSVLVAVGLFALNF